MRPAAPFLLLVLAGLAGCAGNPPTAADLQGSETAQAAAGAEPFTTLRYSQSKEGIREVIWANGTVNAQDTCNVGGCIVSDDAMLHVTDLAGVVPQGVPTLVSFTLDWNAGEVSVGGWQVYLDAPESTVYIDREVGQPGHVEAQAVLRPSGPVAVVLATYGPGGDLPATAYTLRIAVESEPQVLLPGVPVRVALEGGDTLRASSYGGGEAGFLLYGPDDARLGLFRGEHTLPGTAPAGHYVVLLPFGGPTGNLSTDSGADRMDALGLRVEMGPESTLPPNGALDASWEVGGVPLGVGMQGRAGEDVVITSFIVTSGFTARMEGPGGYVLAGEVCGLCISGGYSHTIESGTGDPAVVAGTYTVHAESQAAVGARIQPFAVYLQR